MAVAGRNMLPRILFAWEMGDNFGHASNILEVVRALSGRAHVSIAARNPKAVQTLARGLDLSLGPAPFRPHQRPSDPLDRALASSDNLAFMGWGDDATLTKLLEDWQSVFARCKPDLLVAQAAATALLAARGTGIPTAILGSGFDVPPRSAPMPLFSHWWARDAAKRHTELARREAVLLDQVNQILKARGQPLLSDMSDAFRADQTCLVSYPDLDPYSPRRRFEPDHPPYLGHLFTTDQGVSKKWPDARRGKRILAYLKPSAPMAEAALGALAELAKKHDVMLAAPGISKRGAVNLRKAGVDVTDGPLKLSLLLPGADLGISHASNGIAAAFLMAGVAQLGLPMQAEQEMVGHAINKVKFGLSLFGNYGHADVIDKIEHLLATPDYGTQAKLRAQALSRDPNLNQPAKRAAQILMSQL